MNVDHCSQPPRSPKGLVSYAEVVRELGPVRDAVLGRFRALGGDMNRWQRQDWDVMARALTAAEDKLELEASRSAEKMAARSGLRRVRRALEGRLG
jgi:hypothetical protein